MIRCKQAGNERDAAGEQHGNHESYQHAQAAHAWGRDGVHVTCANPADRADINGDMANQRGD